MKKSGVVILYNPEISLVRSNILTYINHLDKLFVIDNSDISNSESFSNLSHKIEYIANLKNEGISKVLNYVSRQSITEGYDLLLTMDQDSFFDPDMIRKYESYIRKLDFSNLSMIGIVPKNYEDRHKLDFTQKPIDKKTNFIITSGSVLNLKLFEIIGGFNEKLFIDCVDFDYCLKSIIKGYEIRIIKNLYLYHVGGNPKNIFGKRIGLYPVSRLYFIVRNHVFLWRTYFKYFPKLIMKNVFTNIFFMIIPNIIFSNDKPKLFTTILKSIKDSRFI